MKSFRGTCLALVVISFGMARSGQADDFDLLDRSRPENAEMLRDHFRTLAHAALDQRLETYEQLKTPDQVQTWQNQQRDRFRQLLGGFPERTPLKTGVVGKLDGDGFRAEKVIYESRPGFLVTATLYLPTTPGPYPGVLVPCGHTENGRPRAHTRRCACCWRRMVVRR
jgi:hypothetical protein